MRAPSEPRHAEREAGSPTSGHADAARQASVDSSPRQVSQAHRLAQLQAAPSGGPGGLPSGLRQGIETLSGVDMSGVRVHTNSSKPAQLNALAYAQGSDIHLGPGQAHHLPHEAWHLVQQAQGRVKPTLHAEAGTPINDDKALEREADLMGARAAGMVQRMVAPATRHMTPRSGAVAQRVEDLVAQVSLTNDVITTASLPSRGRVHGVLGDKHGSHSTPWSLFVESARNAVMGKGLVAAVASMKRLLNQAKALPGTQRVEYLMGREQDHYQSALDKADAAADAATLAPTQDNLQRLMSAYLEYRNIIPLSAVLTGGPANYNNEGPRLEILRDYQNQSAGQLKQTIFDLLDPKVVDRLSQSIGVGDLEPAFDVDEEVDEGEEEGPVPKQVDPDVPGAIANESIEARIADLITQHLQSVKSGFPEAYYKANIRVQDILATFLRERARHGNRGDSDSSGEEEPSLDRETFSGIFALPARGAAGAPRANIGRNIPGGSVQLRMNDDGTIASALINASDRPEGLFGSADKKHATAWIVFVRGAQRAVTGKTLPQAVTAINGLYDDAYRLPGVSKGFLLVEKQREPWVKAMNAAAEAKEQADADPSVNTVQAYIRAYLAFRNFIPLSAADIPGAGPGGDSESTHIAKVEHYTDHTRASVRKAIYGLLDEGVVKAFGLGKGISGQAALDQDLWHASLEITDRGDKVDPEIPGAPLHVTEAARAAMVITQHLQTIHSNFPEAYAYSRANEAAHIEHFLEHKVGITDTLRRQAIRAKVDA